MSVRAVLWDADGVLQETPAGAWSAATAVVREFPDALVGGSVTEAGVRAVHARLGLGEDVDDVLAVWSRFTLLDDVLAVVADVRASGVPCFLATNQDALRAEAMRRLPAYADLLDGGFYSCDLGVAKPSAAYFTRIADDLGLAPADLLFVDDRPENVAGARAVGLRAETWHHADGLVALQRLLAAHGLPG